MTLFTSFLSVLKFWLNFFKAVPDWLLLWPVSQCPNRDYEKDQNSYLLFIRVCVSGCWLLFLS